VAARLGEQAEAKGAMLGENALSVTRVGRLQARGLAEASDVVGEDSFGILAGLPDLVEQVVVLMPGERIQDRDVAVDRAASVDGDEVLVLLGEGRAELGLNRRSVAAGVQGLWRRRHQFAHLVDRPRHGRLLT